MSTNQMSTPASGVRQLDEVKRRRRLENLLYTRRRIAMLAAEHRSHRLDDAVELWQLQLEVEQVLADEFPQLVDELHSSWFEEDCRYEHHPEVLVRDCSICQAIAARSGVNLEPPGAA